MRVFDSKTGKFVFRKTRRRFDEPGQARELTFSCYHGYQFLNRDRTRSWFLEELESARRKWSFDLWAYVLMPEHVHLLIALAGRSQRPARSPGKSRSRSHAEPLPTSRQTRRIGSLASRFAKASGCVGGFGSREEATTGTWSSPQPLTR